MVLIFGWHVQAWTSTKISTEMTSTDIVLVPQSCLVQSLEMGMSSQEAWRTSEKFTSIYNIFSQNQWKPVISSVRFKLNYEYHLVSHMARKCYSCTIFATWKPPFIADFPMILLYIFQTCSQVFAILIWVHGLENLPFRVDFPSYK